MQAVDVLRDDVVDEARAVKGKDGHVGEGRGGGAEGRRGRGGLGAGARRAAESPYAIRTAKVSDSGSGGETCACVDDGVGGCAEAGREEGEFA